ncbi:MAG: ROK family protein [Anaerolineae bacterium]
MVYRFGVDIGATRTMLALIDVNEPEVIASERPTTDVLFTGRRPAGLSLAGAVDRFLREHSVDRSELVGIGVGIPGTVDKQRQRVLTCPNLHVLDNSPMAEMAGDELGLPVFLCNNTNLIALGEHTAGIGRGVRDMAAVFVGSGLGCGLILDGALYEGADGIASEFGHTIVIPEGLACTCGSYGCLEMYCSGKALTLASNDILTPGEMFHLGTRFAGAGLLIDRANAGHERATKLMVEAFTYLGYALTSLVNNLNPRMIVLGGGVVFSWPRGLEVVRDVVMRFALPDARRNLRFEMSALRNFAGVLGGAAMVSARLAEHQVPA